MNKRGRDKRGISTIIATVIMITLVLIVVGVVWVSVNNLIGKQIETSESCFGNFGKIKLDKRYTCFNSSSDELQFSINIGDIVIDSVLVSISSKSGARSFEISNTTINNVKMYNDEYGELVKVPEKNAGFTYVANVVGLGVVNPDSISIAPIINGNQCEISDSLPSINGC